ncbi:MAG: hypothetical protein P4M00_20715 [Azospirillaceae bacterium]|nr:hypothetical protein [Azospirillaceae bacterium]
MTGAEKAGHPRGAGRRVLPVAVAAATVVLAVTVVATGLGGDALWFVTGKVIGWVFWWCVDLIRNLAGPLWP